LEKYINPFEHDSLNESNIIYVFIPLMEAIKNIPIYTKTIKELCLKKSRRKIKDPTIVQVVGKLASLISTHITTKNMLIQGYQLLPSLSTIFLF